MSATSAEVEAPHHDKRLCNTCKQPIPVERLAVLPTATLCASCKARGEQRGRRRA